MARDRFGFDTEPLAELIRWADIVDGARYESAKAAVEMAAPAMKLTMVIEASGEGFVPRVIPLLTEMSLQEVLDQPFIQAELGPLMERHLAGIELLRERTKLDRGVVTFDITDKLTEGYNKFIPYYLHPAATYNVGLSRSSFRNKVAVGTNPWTKVPVAELANLAAICERYGGGGHARVGAVSFPPDREDDARQGGRRDCGGVARERLGAGAGICGAAKRQMRGFFARLRMTTLKDRGVRAGFRLARI